MVYIPGPDGSDRPDSRGPENALGLSVPEALVRTLDHASAVCAPFFQRAEEISEINQAKVLRAFQRSRVGEIHLQGTTGYGYGDIGREALEVLFAELMGTEQALVRTQIVSGTHALAIGLLGNLSAGDELICAAGRPYDTLLKVVGTGGEAGSLIRQGVVYREIPLTGSGDMDLDSLTEALSPKTKIVLFQRSKGYQWRPSYSLSRIGQGIRAVKGAFPHVICMVDNCYGEFVEPLEPGAYGADLVAGSLIKNPGGTLALNGGYLAGKGDLVENSAIRLTAPGVGREVGASLNFNRWAFHGLFIAPVMVAQAVKGAVLAARFFQELGYPVLPLPEEPRSDIIQAVRLGTPEALKAFCLGIQKASPLNSNFTPVPDLLPGYADEVIMAGGTFIQGSSIELSADGPMRPPYNVFLQGGMGLGHIKTGLALAASLVGHVPARHSGSSPE
ncbi:MAG: methionine gamma-lyase family protein [Peptococcaceae bacterium]|nr:methionine gamma-lyase family protein [Peptococcaceae bacterium]